MLEEEKVVTPAEEAAPAEAPAQAEQAPKEGAKGPRGDRRGPRNGGGRGERKDRRNAPREPKDDMEERVVFINRVSKTVKGGRRMKFTALVVVGDHKGHYGFALSKAAEVPDSHKHHR